MCKGTWRPRPHSRFLVFRLWASGFGPQASGIKLRASGFELQDSGVRLRDSGFGFQASGSVYWAWCLMFRRSEFGFVLEAEAAHVDPLHHRKPVPLPRERKRGRGSDGESEGEREERQREK